MGCDNANEVKNDKHNRVNDKIGYATDKNNKNDENNMQDGNGSPTDTKKTSKVACRCSIF